MNVQLLTGSRMFVIWCAGTLLTIYLIDSYVLSRFRAQSLSTGKLLLLLLLVLCVLLLLVLCEYSKFRIELNSYFSIRFETSTIIQNF